MNDEYIRIFAIMPSEIYKTKDLTSEEKLIAERITALCKKEGYAWISNKALADMYGIRVDTAIYSGYVIPPNYDSMIAKIIVHGSTRNEAISKMKRALEELVIDGVDTNRDFLFEIIRNPDFIRGKFDTSFIEKEILNKNN